MGVKNSSNDKYINVKRRAETNYGKKGYTTEPEEELAAKILNSRGQIIFVKHSLPSGKMFAYRVETELPNALIVRCESDKPKHRHAFAAESQDGKPRRSILFYMPKDRREIKTMVTG